jgi:glycosyltransferase involved in cell wall biosynthesis
VFDVLASTSLWEGLPCTFLEAMAVSKPIVASAVDGVTDVLEDGVNGFLVPAGAEHYSKMAERIVYLLKHKEKALELGRKGREKLDKEFEINRMVKDIENIYAKMR